MFRLHILPLGTALAQQPEVTAESSCEKDGVVCGADRREPCNHAKAHNCGGEDVQVIGTRRKLETVKEQGSQSPKSVLGA